MSSTPNAGGNRIASLPSWGPCDPTDVHDPGAVYRPGSPPQAHTWWTALSAARWSVPRTWKLDVVFFSQQPRSRTATLDGVLPFLREKPPPRVIAVVEHLVQEGLLPRHEASAIEEGVLRCVNRQGAWIWSP